LIGNPVPVSVMRSPPFILPVVGDILVSVSVTSIAMRLVELAIPYPSW
jgi:hypothetical protein